MDDKFSLNKDSVRPFIFLILVVVTLRSTLVHFRVKFSFFCALANQIMFVKTTWFKRPLAVFEYNGASEIITPT